MQIFKNLLDNLSIWFLQNSSFFKIINPSFKRYFYKYVDWCWSNGDHDTKKCYAKNIYTQKKKLRGKEMKIDFSEMLSA